jgi:hypothetical protein
MAKVKCFCGCGLDVPRLPLGRRSANNLGRDVSERLAWARVVVGKEIDPDWEAGGVTHTGALRRAVHDGDRHVIDEADLQRWLEFGQNMEIVAVQIGLPPINLWLQPDYAAKDAMGRWIRESGFTVDEAALELGRLMGAGEPLPWLTDDVKPSKQAREPEDEP